MNNFLAARELIDQSTRAWKRDLVETTFNATYVADILSIPLLHTTENDKLFWKFSTNGEYTLRSAYDNIIDKLLDTSNFKSEGN